MSLVQADEIPAVHSEHDLDVNQLDVQLSESDNLQVSTSQWSQTRSARRKQKRRDQQASQHKQSHTGSVLAAALQPDDDASAHALQQTVAAESQPESIAAGAAAAARSLPSTLPLLSKVRSKRAASSPFSPLGKKRFGSKGRKGTPADQQALQQQPPAAEMYALQQEAKQEEAEMRSLVSLVRHVANCT